MDNLNSIEMIDAGAVVRGDQPAWEFITLKQISPRQFALVAPFSPSEILIAGGARCGDGFVVNLETKSVS